MKASESFQVAIQHLERAVDSSCIGVPRTEILLKGMTLAMIVLLEGMRDDCIEREE
jgi:hypothetical protein